MGGERLLIVRGSLHTAFQCRFQILAEPATDAVRPVGRVPSFGEPSTGKPVTARGLPRTAQGQDVWGQP